MTGKDYDYWNAVKKAVDILMDARTINSQSYIVVPDREMSDEMLHLFLSKGCTVCRDSIDGVWCRKFILPILCG